MAYLTTPARIRGACLSGVGFMGKNGYDAMPGASETIATGLSKAVSEGRFFWFGEVPDNKRVREWVTRGRELYKAGHITHPFSEPYVLGWHAEGDEDASVVMVTPMAAEDGLSYGVAKFVEHPAPDTGEPCLVLVIAALRKFVGGKMGVAVLTALRSPTELGDAVVADMLRGPIAGVSYALALLNTDGITHTTVSASNKLNTARKKRGAQPIPSYVAVDAEPYAAAVSERRHYGRSNQGGTHASPLPHIRRGHVRRLHSGSKVWVRDCLVNVKKDGPSLARTHYEVRV